MDKKWVISISVLLMLIISTTIYFATALKMESEWDSDDQPVVLPNKAWHVTFSEKLDPSHLNDSYIYVTDDKGDKMNVSLSYDEKHKTLTVNPPKDGYDLKRKYTLHLDRKLQSIYGRKLRKQERLTFIVKETLPVVASKDELNQHFIQLLDEQKQSNGLFGREKGSPEMAAMDSGAKKEAGSSAGDFSKTNVQVDGVDEADMIKTDGTYVYQVFDREVRIVKVVPANQMELLSTITFDDDFSPTELYLHENQLVVIGMKNVWIQNKKIAADTMPAMMSPFTKAIIYDVTTPTEPRIVREVETEGQLVQSRQKDGIIYLVANSYPNYWILEKDKKADMRPKFKDSITSDHLQKVDYDKIQYLPDSKEANFTNITTFDLENPSQKAKLATFLGSGNQLYMSENNLYLAVADYSYALNNQNEYMTPNTMIYKFAVNGSEVNFQSSAEVTGSVLNQFSMDEHNGYFRVATTEGFTWDEKNPSANHLFILDKNLLEVGKLNDLARGERIYSARFMGDRIFIVTFKETDPLFVIDAKDPKQPNVLGELKIPGFSNYLHPYDENHIIGFGHDTKIVANKGGSSPRIMTDGVKISLFDVSDMANPKEKFSEIIGGRGTYSSLNNDHKALLFNKEKNLFAFPISVYANVEGSEYEQKFIFQGGYVYHIDLKNGFTLQQKITHMSEDSPYEEWEDSIQRMIYIGDYLYAISANKMTSHSLENSEQVGEVSLK